VPATTFVTASAAGRRADGEGTEEDDPRAGRAAAPGPRTTIEPPSDTLPAMSPVSRGRKSKKQKKVQKSRQRTASTAQWAGRHFDGLTGLTDRLSVRPARPPWFGPSIARILGQDEALMAATGPRELEQVAAALTGTEIYRVLHESGQGLWFSRWFEELTRAAAERIKSEQTAGGSASQAPWRLLYGLAAIAPPALRDHALQAIKDAAAAAAASFSVKPDWLSLCPDGAVTGRVETMRDDYGTRFAVLAECGYPGGVDPHVFSFDIDACGLVTLAGAAVFDSLDQAVSAWRQAKADAAQAARPQPITGYAQLDCLIHCEVSPDGMFRGDEQRAFTDNVFRASRRIHDIASALEEQGQQWPAHRSLYHDRDAESEAAAKEFAAWYRPRHDRDPDQEAIRFLAADWLEGTLPECAHAVSPHRVRQLITYMNDDWLPDEPTTQAAYELLPEWVRWNGEQAGVPGHLIERSVTVAEGRPWDPEECPALSF
jgi:hypothetical protein